MGVEGVWDNFDAFNLHCHFVSSHLRSCMKLNNSMRKVKLYNYIYNRKLLDLKRF